MTARSAESDHNAALLSKLDRIIQLLEAQQPQKTPYGPIYPWYPTYVHLYRPWVTASTPGITYTTYNTGHTI
jgi:hypothetical protein